MTKAGNQQTLKDIKNAIKEFPKVIRQKEAAHKEREKTIKSFMKISRALAKATEKSQSSQLHTSNNDREIVNFVFNRLALKHKNNSVEKWSVAETAVWDIVRARTQDDFGGLESIFTDYSADIQRMVKSLEIIGEIALANTWKKAIEVRPNLKKFEDIRNSMRTLDKKLVEWLRREGVVIDTQS